MTTRQKLEAVSQNLWWSWNPNARDLFRDIAPDVYESSTHAPLAALKAASDNTLNDAKTADRIDAVYADFRSYMETPGSKANAPATAYFCMEYGLHESLALYSGGLGILAGDHCKAASDLSVPFTAVGLLLRDGYFKQKFDTVGWQVEEYPVLDPADHPMTLLTGRNGEPRRVTVHLGDEALRLQAWELNVGRTRLLLLDSDHDENPAHLRPLTRKLYQGDRRIRLQQEIVLGIGGLRMLRALNVAAEVYHLNEGHCAFLLFELMRERMATGETREAATQWVHDHCVFTTHTPVMAGHDRFEPDLLLGQLWKMRDALHLSDEQILAYGRVKPDDHQEWFTMTVLGLNVTRAANGVSKLNGEVAREQWSQMYPDRPTSEVPIGHVTNGIHLPTWTAQPAREFAAKHLGDWEADRIAPTFWQKIDKVSDADVWALRSALRKRLVDFAKQHVAEQTMKQTFGLDPDTLTIGFARRFATYKRAPLFFHDVERAGKILSNADRPVQLIYAGKAHPADEGGKRFIQQIYGMTQEAPFEGRVLFLENYNMEIGRMLVSGCDVWLNNPRRPMEASGTSGQKVSAHGGLNLSILDGWWPEGYDGSNGWSIGDDDSAQIASDPSKQDRDDAEFLYSTIENSVVPEFYDRTDGVPSRWVARMKNAMRELPAQFSSERMVADYVDQMYAA